MNDHDAMHCPYILIRKALTLLESNIKPVDDRIIEILSDFLDATGNAYWIQDLPPVMRVLELLSAEYLEKPEYFNILEKMLTMCQLPPLLSKTSDMLIYTRDLEEYFSILGYLLAYLSYKKIDRMELIITKSLCNLLKRSKGYPPNCVSLTVCIKAVESSNLPEILGQLLDLVSENIFKEILKVCLYLVNKSDVCCIRLLKQDALNHTIIRLEPTWKQRFPITEPPNITHSSEIQHYEDIVEITRKFFKCLSKNPSLKQSIKAPKQFTLWSLKYTLRYFVKQKGKPVDRNNVLAIILYLLDQFPDMDYINSGLALELVLLNIACDTHSEFMDVGLVLSPKVEDFEFRRMLLLSLTFYNCFAKIRILSEEKIIRCILLTLTDKQPCKWHRTYSEKLKVIILYVLRLLINPDNTELREEYIENNGPKILTKLLNTHAQDFESGVLEACLELMTHFARHNFIYILETILFDERIDLINGFCIRAIQKSYLTNNDLKILRMSFHILAVFLIIGAVLVNNVDIIISYLERYLHPKPHDVIHDPKVLICAMRLIWVNIQLDREIDQLINKGVVYLMLDVLCQTVLPVKVVILGALVDLCETGSCIPHLLTWRKKGKKLLPLLMEIYREESAKLGVKTGPDGEIDDLTYPIMGVQQKLETQCDCEGRKFTHPVISDMFASCRPKIYALLQLIHKHHEDVTEMTNETYNLYNEELSPRDQITMLVADKFLDLKIAEAWQELETELTDKRFKCFYPDKLLIRTLNERNKKWALKLLIAQKECIRRQKESELVEEYNFYQELKDASLQPALLALKDLTYQAKATENLFRLCHKILQKNQVLESFKPVPSVCTYHKTYMPRPAVTPVFEQTIEVYAELKHEIVPVAPVSPTESVDTNIDNICDDLLSDHSYD